MKKRLFALLLTAVMLLSLMPAALAAPPTSGCTSERGNGKHAWDEGDPMEPWCETPGGVYYYCQYCGAEHMEVTEPPLGHDWADWQVIAEGNCNFPGQEFRCCRRCGKEEYRETAYQHDFGPWITDEPGTCVQRELQRRTCSLCGYTEWKYVGYGDHLWGPWHTISFPTADKPGLERRICDYSSEHVEEREIPPDPDADIHYDTRLDVSLAFTGTAGSTMKSGDMAIARLTVTNTGTTDWTFANVVTMLEYAVSPEIFDHSDWQTNYKGKTYQPGDSFTFSLGIMVTDDDMKYGELVRKVFVQVDSLVTLDSKLSNDVTIRIPLKQEFTPDPDPDPYPDPYPIPRDSGPQLWLDMVCMTPEPFFFDYMGETADIQYLLTVTNTGTEACDFSEVQVYTAQGFFSVDVGSHPLEPGEYITIPGENRFKESEKDENGRLHITFNAIGYSPNLMTCSNQVSLEHKTDEYIWVPELDEVSLQVVKTVTSTPVHGKGYAVGETVTYEIAVTNTGEITLDYVPVYDELYSETENVDVFHALEPQETRTAAFDHVVTEEDGEYIYNIARAVWYEPDTDNVYTAWSNPVVVFITDEEWEEYGVYIEITFLSGPNNGSYYELGEQFPVRVYWENLSTDWLYHVGVRDEMAYILQLRPDTDIYLADEMAPGESGYFDYIYTVTGFFTGLGHVYDCADIYGYDRNGNLYTSYDSILAPAGEGGEYSLSVRKEEASPLPSGLYYELGQTIDYWIFVKNIGQEPLTDVHVYDTLDPFNEIDWISVLEPEEEKIYTFSYVVTPEDVAAGKVINVAIGTYGVDEGYVPVKSNEVESPTGGREPTPRPPVVFPSEGDSCVLTLTGRNDAEYQYDLHHCTVHGETARKAEEAVSKAQSDADIRAAWDLAKQLWREDMEKMYEDLFSAAGSDLKQAAAQDRLAFDAFLEEEEARLLRQYPDHPEEAAKAIAGLLQAQCAELCYLRHHAPEARPDSVRTGTYVTLPAGEIAEHCAALLERNDNGHYTLTLRLCQEHQAGNAGVTAIQQGPRDEAAQAFQRLTRYWQLQLDGKINPAYKAADKEGKAQILAWRRSVDSLLSARQEMLAILYPDHPERVNEWTCRFMMTILINHCGD